MALLKICAANNDSGFTVLEVLIAMGLAAVIGSLGLFAGMESLRSGIFKDDRDAAIASLSRARSMAVNNVCFGFGCAGGKAHGVHFEPAKKAMIIFQGDDFASRDKAGDEFVRFENPSILIDSDLAIDIVFERLSGGADAREVVLKDDAGNTSIISVNPAGQINWR